LTAIEIQGGIYNPSHGHSSGTGIEDDYAKSQLAASLGWLVVPLSESDLTVEGCDRVYQIIQQRSKSAQNQTPMETSN
jgi:dUTPase